MDNIEEIKKRIDIVDFISGYLQLKKAGINYSALCPFHSEKTPSFMVSPERQSFKCFGCGEYGDAISFFMKIEGLVFPEALKILGERVGVQVDLKPKQILDREKTKRDLIYKINLLCAKYFKFVLWSKQGKQALDYLTRRGLSKEIIEKLKIGYAPEKSELEKYFAKYRISSSEAALAGHPERFRFRIIFPIFNSFNQVIGFSGRILEEVLPQGVSPHPKYLNTPETPVFRKSQALYGINFAKDSIRQNKRVIVVEGQMDVAMSFEAGIWETIASSGTALTEEHLKNLRRFCQAVIFAFDEDEAGQKAAHQAVKMAYELNLEPKLTIIEGYKDVGELVLADKKKWPEVLEGALPPIEWLAAKVKKRLGNQEMTAKEKKDLAASALPFILRMPDEVEKAHYISYLAKIVGVPALSIEKALEKHEKKDSALIRAEPTLAKENFNLDARLLAFLFNFPQVAGKYLLTGELELESGVSREVYKNVLECYHSSKKLSEISSCLKKEFLKVEREFREKISAEAIAWDEKFAESSVEAEKEFEDLKNRFTAQKKERVKLDFAKRIAEAEAKGGLEEVKRLMKELQKSLKNN